MNMRIALSGDKGSGKTAIAEAFVARGFTLINFTDRLKKMYIEVYNAMNHNRMKLLTMEGLKKNKQGHRERLTQFSKTIGHHDKPFWIRELLDENRIDGYLPANIVFDNVRTEEQALFLIGKGFEIIHLLRDGTKREEEFVDLLDVLAPGFVYTVDNNGTIDETIQDIMAMELW